VTVPEISEVRAPRFLEMISAEERLCDPCLMKGSLQVMHDYEGYASST